MSKQKAISLLRQAIDEFDTSDCDVNVHTLSKESLEERKRHLQAQLRHTRQALAKHDPPHVYLKIESSDRDELERAEQALRDVDICVEIWATTPGESQSTYHSLNTVADAVWPEDE